MPRGVPALLPIGFWREAEGAGCACVIVLVLFWLPGITGAVSTPWSNGSGRPVFSPAPRSAGHRAERFTDRAKRFLSVSPGDDSSQLANASIYAIVAFVERRSADPRDPVSFDDSGLGSRSPSTRTNVEALTRARHRVPAPLT